MICGLTTQLMNSTLVSAMRRGAAGLNVQYGQLFREERLLSNAADNEILDNQTTEDDEMEDNARVYRVWAGSWLWTNSRQCVVRNQGKEEQEHEGGDGGSDNGVWGLAQHGITTGHLPSSLEGSAGMALSLGLKWVKLVRRRARITTPGRMASGNRRTSL